MMKERTNPKSVAPHKVKGTVLFTVVIVMMVLIVFLMAALALSATASRRAANTYSTAQTQATARAGVDAIISAMRNNKEIATAANDLSASGTQRVNVGEIKFSYMDNVKDEDDNVSRESIPVESIGTIKDSYIEYAGSTYQVEDGSLVAKDIIKVTAIAKQGTAETSYTAYLLKNPVSSSNTDGENQGFISTGDAVSCNHTNIYGGGYVGFDGIFRNATLWETKKNAKELGEFKATCAHTVYETDFMVNGTFSSDGGSAVYLVLKSPKSGMTVWGDCKLYHEIFLETANCFTSAYTDSADILYKDIPYLYVEGDLEFYKPDQVIAPKNESDKIPFHVYCASYQDKYNDSHSSRIMADVFCYDTAKTSTMIKGNTTKLYDWGTAKVKRLDGTVEPQIGGSYYTKGSLKTDGKVVIAGDLVVEGNLEVASGTLTVGGDVKVRGTVTATGELIVGKNAYFGDSAALSNGNIKLDGAAASIPMIPDPDYEKKSATITYYAEWDAVTNPYWPHWEVMTKATVDGVTSAPADTGKNAGTGGSPSTVNINGTEYTYPYDTTGEVWVHKTTHAISATEPKIVDPSYTPPAGTFTKSALDSSTVIFPKEYEKDVILGKIKPDGTAATNEDYKVVRTVPEVLNATSDPYATIYSPDSCDTPFTLGPGVNVITSSCTLTGSYSDGRGVIIKPPAAGTSIWIKLKDFSLSGSYFIVDDTSGATGDVNIFIEGNVSFKAQSTNYQSVTLSDGSKLDVNAGDAAKYTYLSCASVVKALNDTDAKHYYQIYTDSSLALEIDDIDDAPAGSIMYEVPKPHLNVYSGKNASGTAAVSKLTMENDNAMTAHIKAPYMDFEQTSGGSITPACKLYYNGYEVKLNPATTALGCYGCLICHEFTAGNDWLMLFDGASGGGQQQQQVEDAILTQWRIVGYDEY